ncbi:MAG: L-serine ammonia-lyase [Marinomonas sp.]|uniref:L-serine ammonia-lyase n=1 Tax=unclassified Marinomonas TaxID=196814 RepID=UPI0007AFB8EF|nr:MULTISPECIES: L-serine ammonia-lyase [unclassified Marinomonas]KZM40081.1 serine ammonia-lyase [Marinomonas sp. SBI22]KZM41375.1 serine ammonia-lyase [Marinomonas sp. SBI8L]
MAISLFDLFKVGIGPSSSHTVGPMVAANQFVHFLDDEKLTPKVTRVMCELYGSLGATGKGHGTGKAVLMGLEGELPDSIDPDTVDPRVEAIESTKQISLNAKHSVAFEPATDLIYHRIDRLDFHANGMTLRAYDETQTLICEKTYYSIGGGFIVNQNDQGEVELVEDDTQLAYEFHSSEELLKLCKEHDLSIAQIMLENEKAWRSEEEVKANILSIWQVMKSCIDKGIQTEGILPGGLKVKRRAASLYQDLTKKNKMDMITPSLGAMDWVNLYALAVNEENAGGGRIVTAPTNGAAGIIPAVLHYYWDFCPRSNEEGIIDFFLTAAAIGLLFKENASISGAEVGCQGEVGSACAMAAAGLAAATGGSPEQIENAAEIGMEHNLGLTCDPIGGLVQVPCIERNAMASVKAINSASMALRGDGTHYVSLDKVIKTMRDTGRDMNDKYKETSRGGLAVNVIEC